MIFELNVRYSVRCSECGKKLDCAADTNSAENYDVVLVVEPHDCSRTTPLALDGASAPMTSGDLPADVLDVEGTLPEPPRQ